MRILTLARDLRRRRGRERRGMFVAEGVRAVEELARSTIRVQGLLATAAAADDSRTAAVIERLAAAGHPVEHVSADEFASAADTDTPQGVLAIGEVPRRSLDQLAPTPRRPVLLLDGVQDPGNAGTILRTAAAFDAAGVLALPGTVDLWNAKVVRSAMGATFHFPALDCTWDAVDAFRLARPLLLWGADAGGDALDRDRPADAPVALVVGNEGAGLSADALRRADRLVALPISGRVESLNAAVAAGILLYELTR